MRPSAVIMKPAPTPADAADEPAGTPVAATDPLVDPTSLPGWDMLVVLAQLLGRQAARELLAGNAASNDHRPPLPGELELLTVREVAQKLKVSEQTVRRWISEGRLKSRRCGRQHRIHPHDL